MLEEVDYLCNLDVGGRNNRALFDACDTGTPLVESAATRLADSIDGDQHVLLTTGFPITPLEVPETDGPLGTVVLADALAALGATPVFVVEPSVREPMVALADRIGLESFDVEPVEAASTVDADELLEEYDPAAVVAVERPGRCADDTCRNMGAGDITELVANVDPLFERANASGIPTIGVGDGGNEIGMGGVRSAVEEHVPHGESICCLTPVDALVVAGVSNWGAYGIVCGLSVETGEALVHDGDLEVALIETAIDAGCVDGVTKEAEAGVDGIHASVHADVVELMNSLCETALETTQ